MYCLYYWRWSQWMWESSPKSAPVFSQLWCMCYSYEGFNQINLEYLNYTIMHSRTLEVSVTDVEVATRVSYFGQWTIFGVILYLFPTMSCFHFFWITVQAGIPVPSFFLSSLTWRLRSVSPAPLYCQGHVSRGKHTSGGLGLGLSDSGGVLCPAPHTCPRFVRQMASSIRSKGGGT